MPSLSAVKLEEVVKLREAPLSTQDTWWRPMISAGLGIESMIDRIIRRVERGTK